MAEFSPASYEWPRAVPAKFRHGIVSHNDPNLDNIIFDCGHAVALIDFDLASPGSVVWDLACTARLWVPLRDPTDSPAEVRYRPLARLALFADAYGASADERSGMVDAMVHCHEWCYRIVRRAAAADHPTFGPYWHEIGRVRAERTKHWLATHALEMRFALGLT